MSSEKYFNREISWLAFNERVLQEAEDERNPLIERIRFLGIFSNNRDEFFRVRVANLRRLVHVEKKARTNKKDKPRQVLNQLNDIVLRQQKRFDQTFRGLIKELIKEQIFIVNERKLNEEQQHFVTNYFREKIRPSLVPIMIDLVEEFPFLKDKSTYLAVEMEYDDELTRPRYAIIEIPSEIHGRFLVLPSPGDQEHIILLDDVIRFCLHEIFYNFDYTNIEAYTIKITRDAELDFDDDIASSFFEKITKSLKLRKHGDPVRFVYDSSIPKDLFRYILERMGMDEEESLIPGARYHNFKDFMKLPNLGSKGLEYKKLTPVPHHNLHPFSSVFKAIQERDIMLHYPYHSFNHFIDLLREAAIDPKVIRIQISLYRVANQSKIINALINAAKNGKKVIVVVELQARFDEEANIYWADKLKEAGVRVIFGVPSLKVHSKLCLITRMEGRKIARYAMIGTGNFNESTAKIYGDHSLLTCHKKLTAEVDRVFEFLEFNYKIARCRHLLVSPMTTRSRFSKMIQQEITAAKAGKKAWIFLKMNSLSDIDMVNKLYKASQAGVRVRLIIRGICCLRPGVPGLSDNIEVISIVGRYLEHARIYAFCNDGDRLVYISSADWMNRNLDRRIEVTTPILDSDIQQEMMDILEMQWRENYKARVIDKELSNTYIEPKEGEAIYNFQEDFYKYLHQKAK